MVHAKLLPNTLLLILLMNLHFGYCFMRMAYLYSVKHARWLDLNVEHPFSRYMIVGQQVGAESLASATRWRSWLLPMCIPPHITWASL